MTDHAVLRRASTVQFLDHAPRFLFFTGKGGVGKTSIACAAAVHLAGAGRRVLLVSTDPASNVGQVFGVRIGNTITAIPAVPGLEALEIDPEQAAEAYREKIVAPVRGLLPEAEIASITEQLSGACTTEIASFDEFTGILADGTIGERYDHVLFDTAPTGHTVRLLQLPGDWTSFLDAGKGDASCLGPLSGLEKQRSTYAAAVAALADPARTRLVLVARAQESGLAEVARTHEELARIGMTRQHLVVNGLMPAGEDPLVVAVRAREQAALAGLPEVLAGLPRDEVALRPQNMVGLDALRSLLADDGAPEPAASTPPAELDLPGLESLVDELAAQDHGLVMCMGKGGVGKTTVAAAVAVALAHRGHDVLLTTTDPAAHLSETLAGEVEHLTVSRIDPEQAVAAYRSRVLASTGRNLDETGRAQLAEDLLSPCTEEVAVFHEFSRAVNESRRRFVVMDTAPTGHTLLLLDATGSYHREVARSMGEGLSYATPLMRLQDPELTKLVLVTLAETTPVLEATRLQEDLERADLHPWAWVVNHSVAATAPGSAFLRARAHAELEQIRAVQDLAPRIAVIPLLAEEPVGETALAELADPARVRS
ncbi:arsenical pump-driving ATPase [uncultured Kocuria sp.]|uniref:arsenical pump-driving ATPase n=1 Tax=uncultured Kocuria sp. TaxID=259305 RepID=UPI00261D27B9|nr:arsenical pump-driving ATPase [uncultured Kocuria sp.]